MITNICHDYCLIAQPTIGSDLNFFKPTALFLDWSGRIFEFVLMFSAEDVNAAANQGIGTDVAFTNIALGTDIDTLFYRSVPMGKYCQKADGYVLAGAGTCEPIKGCPEVLPGFSR